MSTMLTDDEAITLMVLHSGGDATISDVAPVHDGYGNLDKYTFWVWWDKPFLDTDERRVTDEWFISAGDAARAYCALYNLKMQELI